MEEKKQETEQLEDKQFPHKKQYTFLNMHIHTLPHNPNTT